ncbi:RIO1 family regulatory kinase/ATPase [Sulfolobus acidocaldarius]|uniref:non-specific serine/threonine protein kinase n=4 Tax=Sulfolobus acidocaldarius TaxID=2285 RepID=Q4JAL3_SULAC|nr:RIO1 family regulatory kinase/ATPase [Sulfolobus acidocaldarius]AAY80166.1 conserved Archaeal protein [Sulfolobus acidocaldarius DSM 639]AGE70744.1 protein of unknown function RIO1 [Sulfolobus acidocaldarius N8]AGE73016.1 protein of unknown function RIO1 [Sulfolobus acidocaldarius Ron12/I]ALU28924.1 serine/threonine protein kinase [Sulfolobus acidocaldarius]ALU31650.1 serine/threonine protein kinase [Sulfolobus acidocaldarius]
MPNLTLAERVSLIGPMDYRLLKFLYEKTATHDWIKLSQISDELGISKREILSSLSKLYDLRLVSKELVLGENAYRITFTGLNVISTKNLYVNKILNKLGIMIGTGKESEVYIGYNFDGDPIIVKYHKLGKSYRNYKKYREDTDSSWIRRTVHNAEKEYNALKCVKSNYGQVPSPLGSSLNAIAMEYIYGKELYKIEISDPESALNDILSTVRIAYKECNIIHGDLSEYNILYSLDSDRSYVIDWPQSTNIQNEEILLRDITNILYYFSKKYNIIKGVQETLNYVKG